MGQPAARLTDMHVCPMVTPGVPPIPHVGGPIVTPGAPNVLIGGLPAATIGCTCVCVGPPDVIVKGSLGVFIGGRPAARMGDNTAHGGVIVGGFPTVLIGEIGMGSVSMNSFVPDMSGINPEFQQSFNQAQTLKEAANNGTPLVERNEASFFSGLVNNSVVNRILTTFKESIKKIKKQSRLKNVFPGSQHYGNCGVQSSKQLIELITCKKKEEIDLLKDSLSDGNADIKYSDSTSPENRNNASYKELAISKIGTEDESKYISIHKTGGTSPDQRQKILEKNGVKSSKVDFTTESLANAIKENKATIVSVDVAGLPDEYWGTQSGGHAIVVADGEFDDDGNLTDVWINDTGAGERYKMKIEDFSNAVRPGRPMNVTNDSMKENCP